MAAGPQSNRAGDAACGGRSTNRSMSVAGRCAYCGRACHEQDDAGVWFCGMEHLLLLRIGAASVAAPPGRPATAAEPAALRPRAVVRDPAPGQYTTLSTTLSREVTGARLAGAAREARLRARTLCEDIDEGLSLAVEASRQGRVLIATSALGRVTQALSGILDSLGVQSEERSARTGTPVAEPLHATLAMVPKLDSDLRAAIHGDRDAGQRARREALGLLLVVNAELGRSAARREGPRPDPRPRSLDVARRPALAACR
jgi:hypothetical protein